MMSIFRNHLPLSLCFCLMMIHDKTHNELWSCRAETQCCFLSLLFLQHLHRTAYMNSNPTDTRSVFTTRLTTVNYVPAPTGQFTVTTSPAPLSHAVTPSHKSAARPAKVRVPKPCQANITTGQFWYLMQSSIPLRDITFSLSLFPYLIPSCRLSLWGPRAS